MGWRVSEGAPLLQAKSRLDRSHAQANSRGVKESATPKDLALPTRASKAAEAKEQRLAAALRANLRRRKAALKSTD
jgi:hypothetical protein